jgi:protein-disulfide isomerase
MEKENKFLIPLAVLVAGALIAGAVFFKSKDPAPDAGNNGTPEEIEVAPLSKDDHVFGNPNAEIVIIEYSDIDCPFCKTFHETMHRIVNEYGKDGVVAWAYRDFPLDQLHPEARAKAEASECVASLGGNDIYWKFLDALFTRAETVADLPTIAAEMGVNQAAFTSCVSEKRFAAEVAAEGEAALAAGGRGTPYSIILTKDGETFPINGAQPYEVVKQVIDTILADQGTATQ